MRGMGNFSVRFYETLAVGRIPVLLNTDCLLPLDKIINWEKHCIILNESEYKSLGNMVVNFHNDLRNHEFIEIQKIVKYAWYVMATESKANLTTIAFLGFAMWAINKFTKDDEETEDVKKQTKKIEDDTKGNPFNYNTFVLPKYISSQYRLTLSPTQLVKATTIIWDGIDVFEDDESEIMTGIKFAKTKTDIAAISATYAKRYKKDLYNELKKNLSKKELGRINKYVNGLQNHMNSGYKR